MENIKLALQLMGYGLFGVFTTLALIFIVMKLVGTYFKRKQRPEEE